MSSNDTICALATNLGESAINIIRISGDEAISIASSILKGVDLTKKKTNTISYAHVVENDNVLDEVLVSIFRAPKSYTKEDVVEINTHGGAYVTERVIELLLSRGCRMADPGEFTKRAFLNGRIDLTEAESVMDMIEAKTKKSLELANRGLRGEVYEEIESLRKEIEDVLLHIDVNIDYPEYTDELQVTRELCIKNSTELIDRIEKILKSAENMRVYKEGIKTIILGKPNVGKSSLLNALLNEERAIVTSYKGTTRDTIEGDLNMNGIILHLIDTAGVRETDDPVERIGINKAIDKLNDAELVLLVLDHETGITSEDKELLKLTENKNRIIIANKSDISKAGFEGLDYLDISALTKDGIDSLEKAIHEMFIKTDVLGGADTAISSSRHIGLLKKAQSSLINSKKEAESGDYPDMIALDLKDAYDTLGEIIGKTSTDSLIDELFAKFCLGK